MTYSRIVDVHNFLLTSTQTTETTMSGVLEQSLDQIIGDNQPRRRERSGRPRGGRGVGSRRPGVCVN